ncbi:MAG: hypothetical protein P8Z00_10000 [Anaerolineales bacterium]|jgi:hypothetical protein
MSDEDELKDWLDRTAKEIADNYPSARTWLSWIIYLLNAMEQQARDEDSANADAFREMLEALQDTLRNRLRTGGW